MILSKKISKYSEDTYGCVFKCLYNNLVIWLNNNPEIILDIDDEELKINFYIFIFKNVNSLYYKECDEYFDLKYSEDIVELFLRFKNITDGYGIKIFENKTSDDLLEFIENKITIDYDEEEKNDEIEIVNDWEY
jgi:hypothetical protein